MTAMPGHHRLPRPALWLGMAGLAPQAAALVAAWSSWRWAALAAGCLYAALILSFLGGLWWVQAMTQRTPSWRAHAVAVAPSLIAFAAVLPWCLGWRWPGPSLVVLGLTLLASPLVDRRLAPHSTLPKDWLALRAALSAGLGLLTLALAFA
ncbi:DUF3429 domain-containing protein [Novosphingobium sp. KCTC 2891]|uniref:DUF3429 domain-containing protein n=1 Tax=Novosphingobium sp. KCTC 2891 TaxID=2989730 RepID=UPI002222B752|nr:DUF3429 domain-containing protein [Novosphingobium sp. KCTC 2891]MCW1381614.1 DUF3429 domain-containing protein [Novosphingobium sp. KCTC 2891]